MPSTLKSRLRRFFRRLLRLAIAGILLLAIGLGVAAWFARRELQTPFKGYSEPEQFVEVTAGSSVDAIARRLVDAGVVRHRWLFRYEVFQRRAERTLRAGEYRFDQPLRAADVVDKLVRGDVYLRPFTVPEGLTVAEIGELFASRGFGTKDAFVQAARDPARIRDLDPGATDLEGYLFPETYALARTTTAADLVRQMVDRFRSVYEQETTGLAERPELTLRQLVTLASLVEEETARDEERPLVAGVYLRRLEIGMPLQCDPTVIYALARAGEYDGNLTRANLQFDSPYNTYRYPGLPPGPIAGPGRASLRAAMKPDKQGYLYFVSKNDGSHEFARTLEEHNRNVQNFQVRYFRQLRAR